MKNWKLNLMATVVFVIFATSSFGQTSTWSGYAYQNSNGISDSYPMIFDFTVMADLSVEGKSFFMVPNNPKLFVYYSFRGRIDGSKMYLTEYKIEKAASFAGSWILKDMVIQLNDDNSLQGTWTDVSGSGISGTLKMEKVKLLDVK